MGSRRSNSQSSNLHARSPLQLNSTQMRGSQVWSHQLLWSLQLQAPPGARRITRHSLFTRPLRFYLLCSGKY